MLKNKISMLSTSSFRYSGRPIHEDNQAVSKVFQERIGMLPGMSLNRIRNRDLMDMLRKRYSAEKDKIHDTPSRKAGRVKSRKKSNVSVLINLLFTDCFNKLIINQFGNGNS